MSINISKIKVYRLDLPLIKPYQISGGRLIIDKMVSTIVSIETNNGLIGWGEGCPFGSAYLPAFAGGIRAGICEIAPALLGQNPLYLDQINQTMDLTLSGHGYVKSAIDMACWDILGKYTEQPLYALLGGRFSQYAELLGSFANDTPEGILEDMQKTREEGYFIFSPKIGGDVALDIARIRAILTDLKPHEKLTVDANRSWLPDQAIQIMNSFNDVPLYLPLNKFQTITAWSCNSF